MCALLLQGVGSTANFKSRLANYKSHIKHKRRTCRITNHFIDMHEEDYSSLKFMLIDQHHSEILKSELLDRNVVDQPERP